MGKRVFDVIVASLLALAVLPLVLVLAIAVVLTLRTQPFFVQERVGRDGHRFRLVKLRTLPPATPTDADKYAIAQLRLPRFTAFLRRAHLDELPQLLLVVTGRMSLVGPRPELPSLHTRLDPAFAAARTAARPGCTGLWQLGPDCVRMIGESTGYDLHYLAHQSVRLDAWVLAQTLRNMVAGWRSVELGDIPGWALRARPGAVEAGGREERRDPSPVPTTA